jgi:hypothetical protein
MPVELATHAPPLMSRMCVEAIDMAVRLELDESEDQAVRVDRFGNIRLLLFQARPPMCVVGWCGRPGFQLRRGEPLPEQRMDRRVEEIGDLDRILGPIVANPDLHP